MRTTDFSRTFLREGYDMSEVRAFLADVERTIRGQASEPDQIVTARKAEEIEFSVKFRGFNMDQVDAEIDRLIGVLRGLDRDREWVARHEGEAGEEVLAADADEPAPAAPKRPRFLPQPVRRPPPTSGRSPQGRVSPGRIPLMCRCPRSRQKRGSPPCGTTTRAHRRPSIASTLIVCSITPTPFRLSRRSWTRWPPSSAPRRPSMRFFVP